MKGPCKQQRAGTEHPRVRLQPGVMIIELVQPEIEQVGDDAEAEPHGQVPADDKGQEHVRIGALAAQAPEDLQQREGGRQHHGDRHQHPPQDVQTSLSQHRHRIAVEADQPEFRVAQVAAIGGLLPKPQSQPRQHHQPRQDRHENVAMSQQPDSPAVTRYGRSWGP